MVPIKVCFDKKEMSLLNNNDFQILLEALAELYSDVSYLTLRDRALNFVAKVIACDAATFNFLTTEKVLENNVWTNSKIEDPGDCIEIINLFGHENPVFVETVIKKNPSPVMLADFLTQRQFQRTAIYNEAYKLLEVGVQMAMALTVSKNLEMSCIVSRKKLEFSEKDRLMMKLIYPHLIIAVQNTFAFERLNTLLETKECGVIALDEDGKILFMSEYAGHLITRYFTNEKHEIHNLPERLANWVKQNSLSINSYTLPPEPLKIENVNGELIIRLTNNSKTREKNLLLEEKKNISASILKKLGLTNREAEILYMMMQGKSDSVIAMLCGIRINTVYKHTQHIYIKLGVENRTSAMIRALEIL